LTLQGALGKSGFSKGAASGKSLGTTGLENGPGHYQSQREVESSCKNLIVGGHLTEERKRGKKEMKVGIICMRCTIE